ncbi:MAG TPA: hypothetical protein DDW27_15400 [Bacteroidales bacterium]|nr:hypothetical protein [Bacteroidales bacterium]
MTFAAMKRGWLLIFKIFFIMTFFFCAGINAFSFYSISPVNTEVSLCTCNDEICICQDIDSLNEDQICHSPDIPPIEELCQTPLFKGTFLIQSYYLTVWQPPRIC